MPVATTNFTTGPATLPDVGSLIYNGCTFSPLFETTANGVAVKDNAQRTVKYMEYSITADGYVTLPANAATVGGTIATLQALLTAQGGALTYQGKCIDLVVNAAGGTRDAAWGPVPELLEFQPLGGGLSAKVRWQVKIRVTPAQQAAGNQRVKFVATPAPLLQFNYETSVSYGEDGYSGLTVRGTMEIPMTRPAQNIRTLTTTVDSLRSVLDTRIFAGIDLNRFRVVRRDYPVSRDKRTLEFDVAVEEKGYVDLPPDCTIARGTYSVKPAHVGMGLCLWLCTLRATYTVRADKPRRTAWFAFLALLREKMRYSAFGTTVKQNPANRGQVKVPRWTAPDYDPKADPTVFWQTLLKNQGAVVKPGDIKCWLIDFSFDEGQYLDSKTVSFSATWRLVTVFANVLLATGLWKKVQEAGALGTNLWATSMKKVSGSRSWLTNQVDPALDVIVDFGGG